MILLHIGDGRILEVLLGAEGSLLAVRVAGIQGIQQAFIHLAVVLGEAHVLLLIDGLKLCVEAPDDVVAETVSLDSGPVVNLVRRNVLGIDGLVV